MNSEESWKGKQIQESRRFKTEHVKLEDANEEAGVYKTFLIFLNITNIRTFGLFEK